MKTKVTFFVVIALSVITGCEQKAKKQELITKVKKPSAAGKELLTVDFQKGQTLRYKFICSRDIELDWEPQKKASNPGKSGIDKFYESMEIVMAYTPIEVDPFGLTTIKATCESLKINRSKGPKRDAVATLKGNSFTFTVGPTGKIEDYSQLTESIKKAGEKAFLSDTSRGRIKEVDMIDDFLATQWFLWDSISSIEHPTKGVSVGQSWGSKLSVPGPMVMRKARDVTYTLAEIRRTDKGKLAVIRSSYSPTESIPNTWPPMPYSGRFQMQGTFGFLRGYQILDLQGQGEELFNIDAGRIEQYNQEYQTRLKAFIPFGIDVQPQITMKQKFSMQLLE